MSAVAAGTGPHKVELAAGTWFWVPHEAEARWQYAEMFQEGCYDDVRLPADALVLDVGANIGLFSYFVHRAAPTARILAFEPMPHTLAALRRNLALHGMAETVTVRECALGARTEESVPFVYYPRAPGNSTRYPEQKELQIDVLSREGSPDYVRRHYTGTRVPVRVERLSAFLSGGEPVALLKIDVEGAELDVLQGIDAAHWPLIGQIVLEVQDLDGRLDAVLALLELRGLTATARPAPLIPADIRTYLVHAVRAVPRAA
ncbi:FkbM family methyltransferase [Streptomyces roseirectus]|uniref:FkbM family methyltransferase n=1 Tax=Streptomyces roseirectus TaxID=2768066 RepID=A0A7H0INN0_9ACTN|nr:FkbM family methyltransferase [Streptomyces roseirectus]QNP74396.1 FkbM family methyltransferase [Streptomyces roseirectus]